jgi:hypothetical protein
MYTSFFIQNNVQFADGQIAFAQGNACEIGWVQGLHGNHFREMVVDAARLLTVLASKRHPQHPS